MTVKCEMTENYDSRYRNYDKWMKTETKKSELLQVVLEAVSVYTRRRWKNATRERYQTHYAVALKSRNFFGYINHRFILDLTSLPLAAVRPADLTHRRRRVHCSIPIWWRAAQAGDACSTRLPAAILRIMIATEMSTHVLTVVDTPCII